MFREKLIWNFQNSHIIYEPHVHIKIKMIRFQLKIAQSYTIKT
jgi:hypothetical protein